MTLLVFDCDGVLADTERDGHLPAFNRTFAEFGLPVCWSEDDYALLLGIGGGKERVGSILTPTFVAANGLPADAGGLQAWLSGFHARKTELFTELVSSGAVAARPGIRRVVSSAVEAGWQLAVASTSAETSVRAVLEHVVDGADAARFTVLAGDIVPAKKPDPGIYLLALERLAATPGETIVVEDSRNGLLAAFRAGLQCVVTPSFFTSDEDFSEASLVVSSLGDPGEPIRVHANRSPATPERIVTLEDLSALLSPAAEPVG